MPALRARHELFAKAVAAGANQTDGARSAGYAASRARVTGSELAARPEIRARIHELQAEVQAAFVQTVANESYTMRDALAEAEHAFQVAWARQNAAGMVAATTLKAKLSGLLVERRMEVKSLADYTDDEIDRILASRESEDAIGAPTQTKN